MAMSSNTRDTVNDTAREDGGGANPTTPSVTTRVSLASQPHLDYTCPNSPAVAPGRSSTPELKGNVSEAAVGETSGTQPALQTLAKLRSLLKTRLPEAGANNTNSNSSVCAEMTATRDIQQVAQQTFNKLQFLLRQHDPLSVPNQTNSNLSALSRTPHIKDGNECDPSKLKIGKDGTRSTSPAMEPMLHQLGALVSTPVLQVPHAVDIQNHAEIHETDDKIDMFDESSTTSRQTVFSDANPHSKTGGMMVDSDHAFQDFQGDLVFVEMPAKTESEDNVPKVATRRRWYNVFPPIRL